MANILSDRVHPKIYVTWLVNLETPTTKVDRCIKLNYGVRMGKCNVLMTTYDEKKYVTVNPFICAMETCNDQNCVNINLYNIL